MIDIDRARELSDAREIERIHGGPDAERKDYWVQIEFYVRAYNEDDAKKRVGDNILEYHKYPIDPDDIVVWDILKVED